MKEMQPRLPIIMSTAFDYRDDFAVWASEAYTVKSTDLSEIKAIIKCHLRDVPCPANIHYGCNDCQKKNRRK